MTDSRVAALLRSLNEQGCIATCTRCPVCERDRKFSVNFRDGLALYCCHRASCGVRGAYAIAGGETPSARRSAPAFVPRPLEADYEPPMEGGYWYNNLMARGVSNPYTWSLGRGFRVLSADPGTAVWMIRDLDGHLLGHQTRTPDKRVLSYFTSDRPRYAAFPKSEMPESFLIVEDCMSAALYPGNAVALLGTNLTREVAAAFRAQFEDCRWYVALDADAFNATMRAVERLRAVGCDANALAIPRDIKDMSPGQQLALHAAYKARHPDFAKDILGLAP